jgi:hypothetical protein
MSDAPMIETKPEPPIEFPVTVTVNGVKVEVVLLLRPGTTVSVKPPDERPTNGSGL